MAVIFFRLNFVEEFLGVGWCFFIIDEKWEFLETIFKNN
jgi:hypothetical protein